MPSVRSRLVGAKVRSRFLPKRASASAVAWCVQAVAKVARAPRGAQLHPALVNGTPGAVITLYGRPFSVMAFTVVDGKIVEIDGIADPDRVRRIAAVVLTET